MLNSSWKTNKQTNRKLRLHLLKKPPFRGCSSRSPVMPRNAETSLLVNHCFKNLPGLQCSPNSLMPRNISGQREQAYDLKTTAFQLDAVRTRGVSERKGPPTATSTSEEASARSPEGCHGGSPLQRQGTDILSFPIIERSFSKSLQGCFRPIRYSVSSGKGPNVFQRLPHQFHSHLSWNKSELTAKHSHAT